MLLDLVKDGSQGMVDLPDLPFFREPSYPGFIRHNVVGRAAGRGRGTIAASRPDGPDRNPLLPSQSGGYSGRSPATIRTARTRSSGG